MLSYILGTMLGAGIVGGLINSYLSDPLAERPLAWWQHIIVGIGAAFMVPVFLNTISSRLIADIAGTEITAEILSKLLVLGGFCLIAAISSRAFIRSMTDRILQEVSSAKRKAEEAKQTAEKAEAIAEATVEPELAAEAASLVRTGPQVPAIEVSEDEKKILRAMVDSRFSMRSLSGIAKDAGMATARVNKLLGLLFEKGLIVESKNKEGQLRWYPSVLGRQAVNEA